MVASPNIPAFKQMAGFWPGGCSPEDTADTACWDWSVDANQVSMLKAAAERGATHLELFSNSPMWWQLQNLNPSGNGGEDNLVGEAAMGAHGTYLAAVATHAAAEWGVAFSTIEALNEPVSTWWVSDGTQEGCHFDRDSQVLFCRWDCALLEASPPSFGVPCCGAVKARAAAAPPPRVL